MSVDFDALRHAADEMLSDGRQRQGQALMNALWTVAPGLYVQVFRTEADCFYDDAKIPAFYRAIGYHES